ncbi:hypothetical protein ABTL79_19140, partial [Acinetobacter baumannii]
IVQSRGICQEKVCNGHAQPIVGVRIRRRCPCEQCRDGPIGRIILVATFIRHDLGNKGLSLKRD